MTADVPGEAVIIDEGGGKATDVIGAFEQVPVGVANIFEMIGSAQTAWSGAKN